MFKEKMKNDSDNGSTNVLSLINGFLVAAASSASVERVFSRFGLVHSKI